MKMLILYDSSGKIWTSMTTDGVVAGLEDGPAERFPDVLGHDAPVAQDVDTNVLLVQLLEVLIDVLDEKTEDAADLLLGALPVLRRERIDRQVLYAKIGRPSDDLPHGFHTGVVAHDTRQFSLRRPSAVAVHDDGNVTGQIGCFCHMPILP